MHLFPTYGIMATILDYGQLISLFLVLFCVEAVLAAKSEKPWSALIFLLATFLLAVFIGIYFHKFIYFVYMLIPVGLCLLGFCIARYVRARNIKKGVVYKDGVVVVDENGNRVD